MLDILLHTCMSFLPLKAFFNEYRMRNETKEKCERRCRQQICIHVSLYTYQSNILLFLSLYSTNIYI